MNDMRYDVAVVGAGQAGLAIGHALAEQEKRFVILEASDAVGSAWRNRWDSLILFTPRRYDALPGLAFPGDADGHPTRDEVASYLERYAEQFELPVELSTPVRSLSKDANGFVLDAAGRAIRADAVVVATGPFQEPIVPAFARSLAAEVFQKHSVGYRRPADLPEGRVLVVGGGNTGFQIAKELAGSREVHLAIGSRQTPLPQRLLGRDLFRWLTMLGLLSKTVDSRVGRRAQGRDTLIGSSRRGYRPDHSWIDLPINGNDGRLRHRRGVSEVPGLYFLGLSWQHTRGSALLGFVADDAAFIAGEIDANRELSTGTSTGPTPQTAGITEGAF
jgi:putative flavoprotein involved in K+ transport